MAGVDKEILARSIQLADQVIENADSAQSFKQECIELKTKAEKLASVLRKAASASNQLLERPTRRIIDYTEQVLDEALTLVIKCRHTSCLMRTLFITIPPNAFKNASTLLQNSIEDVYWILRISTPIEDWDYEFIGIPPIASNEPILGLLWGQIAILYTGTLKERYDAAAGLGSLSRNNDRYGRLIVEEGGVVPLLKLAKEGQMEGQENAARCIGFLCRNSKSVEQIVNCGACSVFAKILEDGHMKAQSLVALAISEMAAHYPKCRDDFVKNNVISLLINHLAFETVQEQQQMSIHSDQNAKIGYELEDDKQTNSCMNHPNGNQLSSQTHNVDTNTLVMKHLTKGHPSDVEGDHQAISRPQRVALSEASIKEREYEEVQMKVMAARALWHLYKGNVTICHNITESRALLCFALLLKKGLEDVKYYSAMALMEITATAEQNVKAIVEQFSKIVEKENSDLIILSIKAIGHLAWAFKATETTRMISSLVKLLDERREVDVTMEAVIALDKFARPDNFLHENHCKAIIEAGGTWRLVELVQFGKQMVQIPSIILLCHIVLHVPDSERQVLAQNELLTVLEVTSKVAKFMEEPNLQSLLPKAKKRLKLYQSKEGSTWISTILFQKECPR